MAHRSAPDLTASDSERRRGFRHDLASSTVGLLIALAFGLMVEAAKDPFLHWLISPKAATFPFSTSILALMFFLTGFSFFLGTQFYLWRVEGDPNNDLWIWDFSCSVVTLTVLVFLGVCTKEPLRIAYVFTMIALYGWQVLWAFVRIVSTYLKRSFFDTVVVKWLIINAAISLITWLIFRSNPALPTETLGWLLLLQVVHFIFDARTVMIGPAAANENHA